MSFILDALKKSESDRQRQSGPALYEVKVAAPRSQLPYWAIGLIVLLGINLVIVAWALLRRPSHADTQATNTAAVSAPPMPAPAAAPASFAPAAYPTAAPGAQGNTAPAQAPAASGPPPAGNGAMTPSRGGQDAPAEAGTDPDDYAPATEPTQAPGFGFHVKRATGDGVPLYSQVATAPTSGIPELRLDMHAFAQKPEDRFVLINMKRLHEGDTLPGGVKVESITPDGVILSHNGSRFLLPRE